MHRLTNPEPIPFFDLLDEDRVIDPTWANLPMVERISDRLADLLFGADEILEFLHDGRAASWRWMEPEIRRLFNDVDAIMRRITD